MTPSGSAPVGGPGAWSRRRTWAATACLRPAGVWAANSRHTVESDTEAGGQPPLPAPARSQVLHQVLHPAQTLQPTGERRYQQPQQPRGPVPSPTRLSWVHPLTAPLQWGVAQRAPPLS